MARSSSAALLRSSFTMVYSYLPFVWANSISFLAFARRSWMTSSLSVPRPRRRRSSSSSLGGMMKMPVASG